MFLVVAIAFAIAASLPSTTTVLRGALAGGAALALALAVHWWRKPKSRASGSYITSDTSGLVRFAPRDKESERDLEALRRDLEPKPLVHWGEPFGVALLASYGRPQALLAFTTPLQTRYVPVRIDGRSEETDELFARISVLADLDLVDGVAHDAALSPESTNALLRHVEEHDRGALGRVYLSDGRGAPIALDRGTLGVGERSFDLSSQMEWRVLMFHESTGQADALYQATWIRQSGSEVFLVAPMPASIIPREPNAHRDAAGRLGRALTRDLRLLQAPAEPPPPREARVAIDRPFMMAVRRALDEAPLAVRVAVEIDTKAKPETRRSMA